MRAIQITEFGGPETLVLRDLPDPTPAGGEQVFDVLAAGVNFADTHATENTYLAKQHLPFIPGSEVVVNASDGRPSLALVGEGAYAEKVAVDPRRLIAIPDGVTSEQALAAFVQGATAWWLLQHSAHLQAGESVVVHAAAGGVGTMAVQLAKLWGAGRVIAVASSQDKRDLALSLGADVAVDSGEQNLAEALREANGGKRVDIVLEMTGGRVFDQSLAALGNFGRIAVFGMAGQQRATPIDPAALMARSQSVVGFWLAHLMGKPAVLAAGITGILDLVAAGTIKAIVGGTYPLADAAEAHRALRARSSVGKLVVLPQV